MALALDTMLPTPYGWTSVHDLQQGEYLFDELGYPCRVEDISEPYEGTAYTMQVGWIAAERRRGEGEWITLSNDTRLHTYGLHWLRKHTGQADYDREWPTRDHAKAKTMDEIASTMVGRVKRVAGKDYEVMKHKVPAAASLQLQKRDVPLEPYVLGVLINYWSDWHNALILSRKSYSRYSKNFEQCGAELYQPEDLHGAKDKYLFVKVDPFTVDKWEEVRRTQERLEQGPIPAAYLRGSEAQRMALLNGLMDVHPSRTGKGMQVRPMAFKRDRGGVTYRYRRNQALVLQVCELVRTLGWPAYMTNCKRNNGPDQQNIGKTYQTEWHPQENIYPNAVLRTREQHRIGRVGTPLLSYCWTLYNCSKPVSQTMRRIEVNSPHGLYAVGERFLPVVSDHD